MCILSKQGVKVWNIETLSGKEYKGGNGDLRGRAVKSPIRQARLYHFGDWVSYKIGYALIVSFKTL